MLSDIILSVDEAKRMNVGERGQLFSRQCKMMRVG
jgi:hypothetical protein